MNNEEEQQYTIYVDMDGVVADFGSAANKVMQEAGHSTYNFHQAQAAVADKKTRNDVWKAITEFQKRHGYVFWRDLEPMPDAYTLWNYLKPYHPQILTATGQAHYKSAEQKRGWITEHFGSNVRVNTVQLAAEKAKFADPTRILIDDQRKALDPWIQAGGIGILHTSAVETIRKLKELGL